MQDDGDQRQPIEFEIKLVGTAGQLQAAKALLGDLAGRAQKWRADQLKTGYFDTSDMRLNRRRLAYRVRARDGHFTQTLKAELETRPALFARSEWETPVNADRPDPTALPPDARARLGHIRSEELTRLFTVTSLRNSAGIVFDGGDGVGQAEIEIALDEGRVTAGRKRSQFREMELELVAGEPAAVAKLAAVLAGSGLRISRLTKAARGYALIDGGTAARPVKSRKFRLDPDRSVTETMAEIFAAALAGILDNEAAALDGRDPEGVHQMRVSIRRLRTALSVFQPFLDQGRLAAVKGDLKWLADNLGPARDWDVFSGDILGQVGSQGIDAEAISALAGATAEARKIAYRQAWDAVKSQHFTEAILGLALFIETRGWAPGDTAPKGDVPIAEIASDIIERAFEKLKKCGRNLAELDLKSRHQVRIQLKKFRYTSDALHSLYPEKTVQPLAKAVSKLQDQFGHLNDLAVAKTLLGQLTDADGLGDDERRRRAAGAGQVIGWHARGVHDHDRRLLASWKAVMATPKYWDRL
ncbi:MAG: CHAD domain-containing protein [Proteobacteria bacterium]|nr:CHAD domain-containing protein [Pseudomonadota bacterium]